MSLFYGYKDDREITEEKIEKRLKELSFHRHNIVFDLNVTRASKNVVFWKSKPEYVKYIVDREGKSKEVSGLFWYGTANGPVLNTSGKYHFLTPKNGEDVAMFVNCPRLKFPDTSVFVVLERNSRKPESNETIFSNGSKGISYYANSDSITLFGTTTTNFSYNIGINLNTKFMISAHWRSDHGNSVIFLNNYLAFTFTGAIGEIGRSEANVFGIIKDKNHYSDIKIYAMEITEGYLTINKIEEINKEMMRENGIPVT